MRRLWFVLLLALLAPAVAHAEDEPVSLRYYIIPVERVTVNGAAYRGPEYIPWRFDANPAESVPVANWSMKDYGLIDQAVLAVEATDPQHAALAGKAGVYQFPANLETTPTGAERTALGNFLEASFIPAQWLSPSDTWRVNLRTVTGMFLYIQRVSTLAGSPLEWGVGLGTRYNQLTPERQTALSQAAADLGYSVSIQGNDTLRQILKAMADAWGARPILFGFTEL